MSARHLMGINLNVCACGESPIRRTELAGDVTLHWVICPVCGTHTCKQESKVDAECAWNDGDVVQAWHLPVEIAHPAPAGLTPAA